MVPPSTACEPPSDDGTLVVTGLSSRAGLSNWVFFFEPAALVMVDVGVMPAVIAGAEAGARAQLDVVGELGERRYGPQPRRGQDASAFRAGVEARARRIVRLEYERIERLRLHLRVFAHVLEVIPSGGEGTRFSLMNRAEAAGLAEWLAGLRPERSELVESACYAFLRRRAPFLLQ